MDSRLRFLWLFLLLAASLQLSQSQTTRLRDGVGTCPQILQEDFGNTSSFSIIGILPKILGIRVKVNHFNLVCESIGLTRNSSSSISVIVEYDREGLPGTEGGGINTELIVQITLDCKEDGSGFDTTSSAGKLKTSGILGNLSTPADLKCGICIDTTLNMSASASTHCLACKPECNEGQMRCTGLEDGQCCNWFSNNFCVNKCPGDTIGDPETFDCGCGPLNVTNGEVTYTNRFLKGSTATVKYIEGLSPGSFMCTESGWVGNIPKYTNINIVSSPSRTHHNSTMSASTTKLSSTTALPSINASKKTCGTSCITGIIVSIVGIISLVAIISAIAYGIYTYLNHPDTAISKDGISDNKNYIAKDNPLYLDPAIVMQQSAAESEANKV